MQALINTQPPSTTLVLLDCSSAKPCGCPTRTTSPGICADPASSDPFPTHPIYSHPEGCDGACGATLDVKPWASLPQIHTRLRRCCPPFTRVAPPLCARRSLGGTGACHGYLAGRSGEGRRCAVSSVESSSVSPYLLLYLSSHLSLHLSPNCCCSEAHRVADSQAQWASDGSSAVPGAV